MRSRSWVTAGLALSALSACASGLHGQTAPALQTRAPSPAVAVAEATPLTPAIAPPTISLAVAKGTPLLVALQQEVRLRAVGQPLKGRLVRPLYGFDQLLVPAGSEVNGKVLSIGGISRKQRTLAILNADLTPERKVEVEFDELVMADGRHIPLQTTVTSGSGEVMRLVSSGEHGQQGKKKGAKDAVAAKLDEAKQQARKDLKDAMAQVEAPGKIHRLEHMAIGQLPARPQYLDAGALYFAELDAPLDFGNEALTEKLPASIGAPPPPGSLAQALLVTPLSSATSKKGDTVEAVLTQPLMDGEKLILPQGSHIRGSVSQVRPAARFAQNGQLRITFNEIVPPEGVTQRVSASLEGVQSRAQDRVQLDSEGGAQPTTSNSRYWNVALSLALAAASRGGDSDGGVSTAGTAGGRAAGGLGGFKLIGIVLGLAVKSQPFGAAMGAYGAGTSVYRHFVAKGKDIVFAKNTGMEIGFGDRNRALGQGTPESAPASSPAKLM